ncbi:MAG: YncE family protein [Candidatus Bathyarchaeia archaeon]|jgi:YVTN family beta-propeller protein
MNRLLWIGCILLAVVFLFYVIALLPLPVRALTLTTAIPVGNGPYGVAFTPNGEYAYVTNQNSHTVSVISTATNTVVATVPLGTYPNAVAVNPNGEYVYVTNLGNNTVSVINTVTNRLTATINVGALPEGVAVTPDGKYVYVANNDPLSNNDSVSVISTATNTVTATITVGRNTSSIALTPDGRYAYVTTYDSNGSLSVINTATNTLTATVPVGLWPPSVTISPNGKYAYVTHDIEAVNYVSVISTATNAETARITVGNDTERLAFTPNGEYAYATVLPPETLGPAPIGNGTLSVINTAKNKMTASLTILGEPLALAVSPNGAYVYVTTMTNEGGAVLVINISNPVTPEFSTQPLIMTLFVFMIITFSVFIIAKKKQLQDFQKRLNS